MAIKHLCFYFVLLSVLAAGCSVSDRSPDGPTVVCIIGTQHEVTETVNPDSLLGILEKVRPDAILCELESAYFAGDGFDLDNYGDLLSTNENIAAHSYRQRYGIPLVPYEIEGRNTYYRETGYFEKEQQMSHDFMTAYTSGTMSGESAAEWERLMKAIPMFDVIGAPLRILNSPLYVQYSEIKNIMVFETFVSVAERDFPGWVETAREHRDFWERRNDSMAANITKYAHDNKSNTLVVFCGQQHKAPLISRLRLQEGLVLKEYWDIKPNY